VYVLGVNLVRDLRLAAGLAPAAATDPRTTDPVADPTETSGSIGTEYMAIIERQK
jgi:hypothetical protein